MKIRPHHLLCIQKFTGHGYDEKFTAHMKSVVAKITENKEIEIEIIEGCDYICEMCPDNKNGVCVSDKKVSLMDSKVRDICKIGNGEKVKWKEAEKKANEMILKTEKFEKVCAVCEWYELCKGTKD